MGQAKSLSAASLGEDLKGINQQMNTKQTTKTILEETAEPQQILGAEILLYMGKKVMNLMCASTPFPTVSS